MLPQRILDDQRLELAHDVALMPEGQVRLDPQFERSHPQLLETRALVPRERLRELGQRASAPEREGVAQQRSRLLGLALRERPASAGDRAFEASEVDLVVCRLEQVARSTRQESPFRKCLAQLRDVDLHHLLCRFRHLLTPQGVHELLASDGAVGLQQQDRQQRPLLSRRDRQRCGAIEDR